MHVLTYVNGESDLLIRSYYNNNYKGDRCLVIQNTTMGCPDCARI